jgi:hypothetical protein
LFREIRAKLLDKSLKFVHLGLLFMPVISGIAKFLIHILLDLVGRRLGLNIVLVELVLNNQIITETLVENLNLVVFSLEFMLLAFIDLEEFLELKLKEGDIISGLLISEAGAAILIGDFEMDLE